ncbi:hypothetical protein [Loigolactobacillus backii]|uniref:hypothetical protein n=1 Tax=Loigolactobacillus backii TaxID=375175 RepID=UPI0007F12199|nr:hypothetical protein [Loigolactobacillus backii]ANK59629.1 hypothetical protein AYR52_04800 [Loigolactobacillus backii]ANK64623.1 hypothetical protein AYR54_04815 [Loigolactobacillus backii]ANK66981.1 hypothetical protein AYR55_04225 [Loigolactobacillus backii]MDA5388710.1 hypothetical protein [Loigolactobacillus backii]MDA5391175.1 hypothetical protein [Loigolactobacillus backii]
MDDTKQLITVILNDEDVHYKFDTSDKAHLEVAIKQIKNDKRPLESVKDEIKEEFDKADFTYHDDVKPESQDADLLFLIDR